MQVRFKFPVERSSLHAHYEFLAVQECFAKHAVNCNCNLDMGRDLYSSLQHQDADKRKVFAAAASVEKGDDSAAASQKSHLIAMCTENQSPEPTPIVSESILFDFITTFPFLSSYYVLLLFASSFKVLAKRCYCSRYWYKSSAQQ